jgi:hypothetical protein
MEMGVASENRAGGAQEEGDGPCDSIQRSVRNGSSVVVRVNWDDPKELQKVYFRVQKKRGTRLVPNVRIVNWWRSLDKGDKS